ncbi:DUF4121 family protein [Bacillus luti]|nr:DUF4121 family protein [Bacillus cereus]HDR8331664.1 DUF4121 family protein [Bacillus cereus]HDR8337231.1 DUF4121 family protein [Bacillus cereus]
MTKYTIESLKEINASYDKEHRVTDSDVIKANQWVKFIEDTRDSDTPKQGDIVIFTDSYGYYYSNTNIENIEDDEINILALPQTPFVGKNRQGNELTASGSGSSGYTIPVELKYVGKKEKEFQDWGHCGATRNGTIRFNAEVNVWEYSETDSKYTTRDYDRFHMFFHKDEENSLVQYIVSSAGTTKSYFTKEEYDAWLITYRGTVQDSYDENNKTIWTYKQISKRVSLEDYENIQDAFVDKVSTYFAHQECKRVYSNTTVTTYLPPNGEKMI